MSKKIKKKISKKFQDEEQYLGFDR